MSQFKRYATQAILMVMVANSCTMAQAIDWNYWSDHVGDTAKTLAKYAPSKDQLIERLTQRTVWGALTLVTLAVAGYVAADIYMAARQPNTYTRVTLHRTPPFIRGRTMTCPFQLNLPKYRIDMNFSS